MIKSGFILTFGNILGAVFLLIRNVLVARLISVEDFGVASTFAITLALLEMITNFALDRLIVQARDGERESLQSTLHSLQIIRGALASLVLFLMAAPIAHLFTVPEAAWAYQVMAIVPLLRGFEHLDIYRLQRELKFGRFVLANLVGQVISTVSVWPLAVWHGDYRIMLWAILVHQTLYVLATHLVADRRFRATWDVEIVKRALNFGVPLLLNGVLLFGVFHGDRVIVANQISLEVLGWFSVAFTLTLMPGMILAKTVNGLMLPILSKAEDGEQFERLSKVTLQAALVIGLMLAIGFFLLGGPVLLLLFGEKFLAAVDVVVWLALMQALRLAKAGPAVIAMARAETKNPMFANIVRVFFLPVALYCAAMTGDVRTVVWIAMVGEGAGFLASLVLLSRRRLLPAGGYQIPILVFAVVIIIIAIEQITGFRADFETNDQILLAIGLSAVFMALIYCSMSDLRRWFKQQI